MGRIAVNLQEHLADAQRRALPVGDDDFDLFHTGHPGGHGRRCRGSYRTRAKAAVRPLATSFATWSARSGGSDWPLTTSTDTEITVRPTR